MDRVFCRQKAEENLPAEARSSRCPTRRVPRWRMGRRRHDCVLTGPDAGTRLLRVSAAGGKAEPLTSLAEDEAIQLAPQVLPGGKAVLYTASTVAGAFNDANLVVQALPSGARKVITRGGYHGRYLMSGHLVYIHDGTLFAVPFDLDRLEVTGQAILHRRREIERDHGRRAVFRVSQRHARLPTRANHRRRHTAPLDGSIRQDDAGAGLARELAQSSLLARWPPTRDGDP